MRKRVGATALTAMVGLTAYQLTRIRPVADRHAVPSFDEQTDVYAAALSRLTMLQAEDTARVNPRCRTRLLTHGHRTARAIVLMHGFTNCPHQFCQLAEQLHALGHNVLIPRIPYHGFERLADDLKLLRAEDLVAISNRSVDIARGLGEHVTLLGFSMGGVLAAWCAQNRADIDRVVMVSPGMGMAGIAPAFMPVWANALAWLPNFYRWWDPKLRDARNGPDHAYPRFASHSIAAILRLSLSVQQQARATRPAVDDILVISNPVDDVVRNALTEELVFAWRYRGANVTTHEFPAAWQLIHDLVDPYQPLQQTALVNPFLCDLI